MHTDTQPQVIHAYENRALQVRIQVDTPEDLDEFTALTFTTGPVTKTGLTAEPTDSGFTVDITLTAADLDYGCGTRRWELTSIFAGNLRSVLTGWFTVDPIGEES